VNDRAAGPVSVYRRRGVRIWLHIGGLFLGEGAYVAPEGVTGGTRGMRAAFEAVGTDFGLPRWWRRWTLFYCAGSADMAADAAGYAAVPLCWGRLPGGPGDGIASWGGF
jgi:hypothetical protein